MAKTAHKTNINYQIITIAEQQIKRKATKPTFKIKSQRFSLQQKIPTNTHQNLRLKKKKGYPTNQESNSSIQTHMRNDCKNEKL